MLYALGKTFFSKHQIQRIQNVLKERGVSYDQDGWSAHAAYWLVGTPPGDISSQSLADLSRVLEADWQSLPNQCRSSFWVLPRRGTRSPWSTKATEILHLCGFSWVDRVESGVFVQFDVRIAEDERDAIGKVFCDRMTQEVVADPMQFADWFDGASPAPGKSLDATDLAAISKADVDLGLALSDEDKGHLLSMYKRLGRSPTDAELMMFAQVNSEHCRHKIFNADWSIDGRVCRESLFAMIRHTHATNPGRVAVAYSDNAAVISVGEYNRWWADPETSVYKNTVEESGMVFKVETHNHPTGISPFPGAATGSGGEIRDEAATGRGAVPKMGMVGFAVSNLHIPGYGHPWEVCLDKPGHMASSLDVMLAAPIGAASYNNEFGRPNLCGFFRSYAAVFATPHAQVTRGYHKPLMIAGGVGVIRSMHSHKLVVTAGAAIIVLGGPGMLIGLGGGAMSSRQGQSGASELDFASVQRANPEMERRAQEVINTCFALGDKNPILSIHDVGAGGLSNAVPEIVHACGLGADIDLRSIPVAESGMSPMEIWCNESQERYVLAVDSGSVGLLEDVARRERVPLAVIGYATEEPRLVIRDEQFGDCPVDLPMAELFESMPRMQCSDVPFKPPYASFSVEDIDITEALERVLQHPVVANKSFLITIGDRSVGGLVVRDQMVGPWQVPVADVAVSASGFGASVGEAMAVGERSPIAVVHPAAAARMALGEAITNIAAAAIGDIGDITFSANWMSAVSYPGEGSALYAAVEAVAKEVCPQLKICIPVGKDSLSMRTQWSDESQVHDVVSPSTLVMTACAPVVDVGRTLTPQIQVDCGDTVLLYIDLGNGCSGLAGSVLVQVYGGVGSTPPDLSEPQLLVSFFHMLQAMRESGLILAYHDRSDGGLIVTILEMMFAGRVGVDIRLGDWAKDCVTALFNEELGAVIQVLRSDVDVILTAADGHGLGDCVHMIGELNGDDKCRIFYKDSCVFAQDRSRLGKLWSTTSYRMQALRDNPSCAEKEYGLWDEVEDPGLSPVVRFAHDDQDRLPWLECVGERPRVAILREQGVNGHVEMAAAFAHVGFEAVDVHMEDLLGGRHKLGDFCGMAVCGGFSYGDVLSAGRGWAQVILHNEGLCGQFREFFGDKKKFVLGVCNGCQMLSALRDIIPGASYWPRFIKNSSAQFEARLSMVEVRQSASLFFKGMVGSVLPVVVSHGEGRVEFFGAEEARLCMQSQLAPLVYVDNRGNPTQRYPQNPNGSMGGLTAFTNDDGRITIMMPHPERVFLTQQCSWHPSSWGSDSPWAKMFLNAREWVFGNSD